MSIFAINSDNGFLVTGGTINRLTGIEAVLVNCQHEAQVLRGEDPFDKNRGMPNFEEIWAGQPNVLQFEFSLRNVLSVVKDVDSLSNFKADISSNVLDYEITINTPFGSDSISGSVSF